MQTVALGVLVFARTDQPAWTGLVAAAGFLPIGLLAPLGGALADRLDRRRWLICTTLAEMSFATVLAVLAATGHDPPGVLVLLSFLGGASGAIGFPAYQAMVPDLVPPGELLGAVSLSSAQFNLGRVIGPALAGLALLTHDYGLVFGINAASFAAVVVALVMVRLPPPLDGGDRSASPPASWWGPASPSANPVAAPPSCSSPWWPCWRPLHRPGAGHGRRRPSAGAHRAGGHGAAGHRPGCRRRRRRPGPAHPGRAHRSPHHDGGRAVPAAAAVGQLRVGPGPVVVGGQLRGGGRRLYRRALGAQHRGSAAGPGRIPWTGPQHLHDGSGHRLSPGARWSRGWRPITSGCGRSPWSAPVLLLVVLGCIAAFAPGVLAALGDPSSDAVPSVAIAAIDGR